MDTQSGSKIEKSIGTVIHYFDKAMVAVIRLSDKLELGEVIKISRNENEAELKVESMQVEHQPITEGKAGDEVAIKVASPTKEGALVFKVSN